MSVFQIIGLGVVGTLILCCLVGTVHGSITQRLSMAWLLLWLIAGVAIAYPKLTVTVARLVGIGRGADLVFYCAIFGILAGFFLFYLRLRRIEASITKIVRHIAVTEAISSGPLRVDLSNGLEVNVDSRSGGDPFV